MCTLDLAKHVKKNARSGRVDYSYLLCVRRVSARMTFAATKKSKATNVTRSRRRPPKLDKYKRFSALRIVWYTFSGLVAFREEERLSEKDLRCTGRETRNEGEAKKKSNKVCDFFSPSVCK